MSVQSHERLGYSASEYVTKPDLARTIAIVEANHRAEMARIESLLNKMKSELAVMILIMGGVAVGAVAVGTAIIGYLLP